MGYIHFFASGPFKSNYSTRLSTSRPTAANWADKVGSGQIKELIKLNFLWLTKRNRTHAPEGLISEWSGALSRKDKVQRAKRRWRCRTLTDLHLLTFGWSWLTNKVESGALVVVLCWLTEALLMARKICRVGETGGSLGENEEFDGHSIKCKMQMRWAAKNTSNKREVAAHKSRPTAAASARSYAPVPTL